MHKPSRKPSTPAPAAAWGHHFHPSTPLGPLLGPPGHRGSPRAGGRWGNTGARRMVPGAIFWCFFFSFWLRIHFFRGFQSQNRAARRSRRPGVDWRLDARRLRPPTGPPGGTQIYPVAAQIAPGGTQIAFGGVSPCPPRPVRGGAEGGDSPTSLGGVSPEPGRPAGVRRRQQRGAERG